MKCQRAPLGLTSSEILRENRTSYHLRLVITVPLDSEEERVRVDRFHFTW